MTRNECVYLLLNCRDKLMKDYGILSMRLFGSMARDEENERGDVDVFVDTETPNPFLLMQAKDYLETAVGRSVDVVRNHRNLNPRLRSRIERDGVLVF
ncbi:MAG: nucleotidyltransferase domain-containing protein [Prevotella sp.]|nr:nucleotidyltransferase domain-containing protein [Prevotella sp.]